MVKDLSWVESSSLGQVIRWDHTFRTNIFNYRTTVPRCSNGLCPSPPKGILLEHREKEFGDKVNMLAVLRTAREMQDDKRRQTSKSE